MEFSFNKKKFRKDVRDEVFSIIIYGVFLYLYAVWKDGLEMFSSFWAIVFLGAIFWFICIYPLCVMINYYNFNKNSTVLIEVDKIIYKNVGKNDIIIPLKEVETIYQIKGRGRGFDSYYYEIRLKDDRMFYISCFVVSDMEEYVRKTVRWRRKTNMFLPGDEKYIR